MATEPTTKPKSSKAGKTARIGMVGYARIMRSLWLHPASHRTLIDRGLGKKNTMYRVLGGLHAMGLIYVKGWEMPDNCRPRPVYAVGEKSDAPPPTRRPNRTKLKFVPKPLQIERVAVELLSFGTLVEAMTEPLSLQDLVVETGTSLSLLRPLMNQLVDMRLAYVHEWRSRSGHPGPRVAMYAWGLKKPNAPRPPPLTRAEISQRERDRKRGYMAANGLHGLVLHAASA